MDPGPVGEGFADLAVEVGRLLVRVGPVPAIAAAFPVFMSI
jgi:hypothetical protein